MNGKHKAATLLMNLDVPTVTELLKGLPSDDIEEIALELARLDASGNHNTTEQEAVAAEFFNVLQKDQSQKFSIGSFFGSVLEGVVGKGKAQEIQSRIRKTAQKKDQFIPVRAATTDELVLALKGEHPQTVAVVLSELAPDRSQEVLAHLDEEVRIKAVCKMTSLEMVGHEVKQRIANMVSTRLEGFKGEVLPESPEQTLRKLAIVLSGLERELRDQLLDEIKKQSEETCTTIRNLMITWEDIPSVADRSLQEALRAVDSAKLAVALFGADRAIVQKIRSNISERAAATLDEEASLMQEPLPKEVLDAREEVVKPLREANELGTLRFTRR